MMTDAGKAEKKRRGLKHAREKKHEGVAGFIVDHNKGIRDLILILIVINLILFPFVEVNYDLTSYLPDTVDSKIAINKMEETFGYPGTGRLMLKNVTIYEAKQYKTEIEKIDGVDQVLWCDTLNPIYVSSSFIRYDNIDDYYKDGNAVMDITFVEGDTSKRTHRAIASIEKLCGEKGNLVGMSPTNKFTEEHVKAQMTMIMAIVVVLVFLILLFTTTSYFEPVLFLTVIGAAIAINKGSNIILGRISYVTNNVADVLQMATSMDYSVFFLHAYEREREEGLDKIPALKRGLNNTLKTVLSSSMTTFFGFVVLVLMNFKMGVDLGIVLAKGILCSLAMVILLMPSLLLSWSDRIDRTRHKPFMPKFEKVSVVLNHISPYLLIISILSAGFIYAAQGMNSFMYGSDATGAGPGTTIYDETREVEEIFGRSNLLVAIFPTGSLKTEEALVEELKEKEYVKKVMGYTEFVPKGVPEKILPSSITEQFHKDGYARLLIYIKTKPESPSAYQYSDEVSGIIRRYYPGEAYITGNTPTTKDMEDILIPDYQRTNNLAMLCIYVVVAIAFRSLLMPIVAMIPIMMAIYLNMSFPYFSGATLIFIAYAVVSCIQLGSTIDYAILSTDTYLQLRKSGNGKKEAARLMSQNSMPSLLTSGLILVICGYAIYFISSVPAISEVGHLVGRGAIFSLIFVSGLMPILLKMVDRFITVPPQMKRERRRAKVKLAAMNARNRRRKLLGFRQRGEQHEKN